jgi:hypothetical protein
VYSTITCTVQELKTGLRFDCNQKVSLGGIEFHKKTKIKLENIFPLSFKVQLDYFGKVTFFGKLSTTILGGNSLNVLP